MIDFSFSEQITFKVIYLKYTSTLEVGNMNKNVLK